VTGQGDGDGGLAARPRRYRPPGQGRTVCRIRLGEDELEELREAAGRVQMSLSGYIAEAALSVARNTRPPTPAPWREALAELAGASTELRRIGGNLNQLVARVHATGQTPARLGEALRIVLAYAERVERAADRTAAKLP
jgi:hypothetical protein